MIENTWVSAREASNLLGVSEGTLQTWREVGYLKPGTHWRSSPDSQSNPWKPDVIYHIRWCKEEMAYWKAQDAPIRDIAA